MIGTTVGIGSQGIVMDGTEEQKQEWLPKLAAGMTASFALTEPNAGSDAASIRTAGKKDGDVYRINGNKRYITNAPRAGTLTVMARTEDARVLRAYPPSSSPPTRRGSASASPTRRWARRAPFPATSTSTT